MTPTQEALPVEQIESQKLAQLIETRLLGIDPDSQDLVLEDHDWLRIIAALRTCTAPDQPTAGHVEAVADHEYAERERLQQIADGAWGDGPFTRGAAKRELERLSTPEQPEQDRAVVALRETRALETETLWSGIPDRYTGERRGSQTLDAEEVFAIIDAALTATSPAPQELGKDTNDAA